MPLISAAIEQDSESALWASMASGAREQARERLFSLYAGYARTLAWKQFHRRSFGDLEFEELRQLASIGLIEAIDGFDPARGIKFRTYAAHRISGSISDGIARMSEVRRQHSVRARIRRERLRSLVDDDVGSLSDGDAIDALTELAMGLALGVMLEGTALYQDDAVNTAPAAGPTAYDSAAWHELVGRLEKEVQGLPERESSILKLHYVDGVDFETLARLLSLSKGRISQLHRAALTTLRKRLVREGHFSLQR